LRYLRGAPLFVQVTVASAAILTSWLAINGVYQVVRKPTELFFPVSGTLYKTPAETWDEYESLFREHATPVITAELLAALAQVEGSGNPIVRTYWRWRLTPEPFEVYRPASSAVGMYQITDGTFLEARRYCIHDNRVVADGAWNEWDSCWFNWLYTRVIPGHAVEMTSAYLDHRVRTLLERRRIHSATLRQKQDLATIIHLCGAGAGDRFARHGFRVSPRQKCGDHEVRLYLQRVHAMRRLFMRLAAGVHAHASGPASRIALGSAAIHKFEAAIQAGACDASGPPATIKTGRPLGRGRPAGSFLRYAPVNPAA
jgi:hypothetical protein